MQAIPQSLLRPLQIASSHSPLKIESNNVAPSSSQSEIHSVEPSPLNSTAVEIDQSSTSTEALCNHDEDKSSVESSLSLYERLPLSRILPSSEERMLLDSWFRPTNISWCLICSRAGEIICCEGCPSSFHLNCLQVDDVSAATCYLSPIACPRF